MKHCKIGRAKKLLSFLLCVAVLASMLVIPAQAADGEPQGEENERIYYRYGVNYWSAYNNQYSTIPMGESGKILTSDSDTITIALPQEKVEYYINEPVDGKQFAGWTIEYRANDASTLRTEETYEASNTITVNLSDLKKGVNYRIDEEKDADGNLIEVYVFYFYPVYKADTYVLMNIPYADFYAAEGTSDVDAVSSATKAKTRTGTLAGGSYHVNSDGSDITGITFPVKVGKGVDLSACTEITDDSSVEIEVTNRGQTSTTTYTDKEALFEADSYAYYVLSETPGYYKELTSDADGNWSFGKAVGSVTELEGSTEVTTETTYGDYQIDVTSGFPEDVSTVYGVLLTTEKGDSYGLRHVENIWRKTELAWSVGYTTVVHGCNVSYEPYASSMGQTVTKITYYTDAGIYTINCNLELTPYYEGEVTAVAASSTAIDLYGLPGDIENAKAAVYYTEGSGRNSKTFYVTNENGVDITGGRVPLTTEMKEGTAYTVYITSDNYAQITAEVQLTAEVYALMNVPYNVFYGKLKNDVEVDAVTSATTQKAGNCANVYSGGATVEGGMDLNGVVVPVKMSRDQYSAIKASVTDSSAAYYISVPVSDPAVYLELTDYDADVYTFSEIKGEAATTDGVEATITSNTVWGDYQVNLSDSSLGKTPSTVYGVYFTTENGDQYAMRQSENLWTPGNYYEFAWSTGVQTSDIHGGTLHPAHYASMEGQTITSITYITTTGIETYNLASGLYVAPHHAGQISAVATGENTLKLLGVPADLENVTVSVATSGRGAVTLADNVSIGRGGIVTLDEGCVFAEDTVYNVVVSSSNYAAMTTTVTYTPSADSGSSSSGSSNNSSRRSYTVSLPTAVKNGVVTSSSRTAEEGDTVTITVTPDSGYKLDSLKVTDQNGNTVKLTQKSDTKYTFIMPASNVTVTASFTESAGLTFKDVAPGAYYYDAVEWAVERGITAGTTATTFSPDDACTRAQTVTFLWRAAGSPAPKSSTNPFTDVAPGAYYYDAVLWAVEQGITTGTTATTFSPDSTVTRAQTVTFLYRAAGSPTATGHNPFADVATDAYYASAVNWAVSEGITTGVTTTAFSPDASCTRAQIVTFLYRAG